MALTDGMPYDAVFTLVEGDINLVMHPKFQNQTQNVGSQRLATPAGVTKIALTWDPALQGIRVQWATRQEGSFAEQGSWKSTEFPVGSTEKMKMITIPTVHGALIRAQTIGGVPNAAAIAARPTLGVEVYPSLSAGAGGG